MNKIQKALTSRTTWTIIVMFIIGGINAITEFIPEAILVPLNGLLSLLAVYFKVNPSKEY